MEKIDWANLGFGYIKTDFNVRCYYKDGKWGEVSVTSDENIPIHMAATALHYGQEAFEGLKAYRGKDGKIRVFRMEENARRMQRSADYVMMQAPSEKLFEEVVCKAVLKNERFIPPYGTGASLYIRPLLIGTGAQVGVSPSKEYLFIVFVTPVGPYYKAGFNPIKVMIDRDHDRAAPQGTGHVKVGGNYAASLLSGESAKVKGYSSVIYLDSKEKRYIDECGAANFFGIKDGSYITPNSPSVLPSITNMSLRVIAEDIGLKVENRAISVDELQGLEEAGACGTAAVISPIGTIDDPVNKKSYVYGDGTKVGPWSMKLYKKLTGIQLGEEPDTHNWITIL